MIGIAGRAALLAAMSSVVAGACPAAAYTVYVSNEKGNSVTVLDSATLEVLETIPVGQRPRGIMLTNDDKYLLVCASDDATVQVVDVATREIVGDLPSGPDPELLNLHPSGSPVYIANEDDNLLTVIDLAEKKVLAEVEVGVEPEGVGIVSSKTVVVFRDDQRHSHRHHELRDHRQCSRRVAAALRRVHGVRKQAVGHVGSGRHRLGHRCQDAQDHQGDRL
jgi:YVTN family beta-propeller protein